MRAKEAEQPRSRTRGVGTTLLLTVVPFALVVILWSQSPGIVTFFFGPSVPREQIFDGIAALFGGLAFAGLLVTIWQQRTDLHLQREELKLQREELREQNAILGLQAHDSMFFHLLESFERAVSDVRVIKTRRIQKDSVQSREESEELHGRAAISELTNALATEVRRSATPDPRTAIASLWTRMEGEGHATAMHQLFADILAVLSTAPPARRELYRRIALSRLDGWQMALAFYYHCALGDDSAFASYRGGLCPWQTLNATKFIVPEALVLFQESILSSEAPESADHHS